MNFHMILAKKLPKIFEKIEKIEKIEKTLLTFPGLPEPGCKEYCSWGSSGRTILLLRAEAFHGDLVNQFFIFPS